jgi:hypothetical protein
MNIIRARGSGLLSTPFRDQSISTPSGASPPSDRKVARRDNGEEPQPRERENNAGGRQYVLTLPPGDYRGEDDEQAGLTHVHRRDGDGPSHVCSLPHGNYEIERDESGSHVYRVEHGDEEHGEREGEERRGERESEERDLAMGPGAHLLPRASGVGRGRDLGPTEFQRLRAYKQHLAEHYGRYRQWLHNRSAEQ